MTTTLFPDAAVPAGPTDGDGPRGRWSLHRAGILNVWQYDRVELAFAGGRMLLRGKNGAGKSKLLEVLLPFLLDGDTRLLDATGRDRTTVTWLMTDGRPPGNHVGYVWLELRCLQPDGSATYQTVGAGLKASTATRKADSWYFLTDRRVGIDLDLDIAGECLSIDRLKAAVGEDAVTASGAEHRRRVGRHVFGLFDDARYRNLLHLLHRLRDPNIGNRVEAGELANVLADALPPIDERVLTEAASHFDDLDAIREQVDRFGRAAHALGEFLGVYRGYTRTVLSRRAAAVAAAEAERIKAAREASRLARSLEDDDAAIEAAQTTLDGHRHERIQREAERRELERSEGYRAHQDLIDRQQRIDALGAAAGVAEVAAQRAADAHHRTVGDVEAAGAELQRSVAAAAGAGTIVAGMATGAGLDAGLIGATPRRTASGDVEAADVVAAADRARAGLTLVERRRQRASELRQLAQLAEDAGRVAGDAEERAAASEAEVDRQREAARAASSACDAAERDWVESVMAWMTSGIPSSLEVSWDGVVGQLATRGGEPTWMDAVRRSVLDAIAPAVGAARRAAAHAEVAVVRAEDLLASAEDDHAEVERQTEARPAPGRHRDAERDPRAGAPFYELVDVSPDVDPAAAAGLEAALEAAGLLDAWVHADGLVVHPDTRDVLLVADRRAQPARETTLADVLVPAPADDSAVSHETIARVLGVIALGERSDAAAWVTTGGRWSLGVLHGAWRKDTVEYLGAANRRATRQRWLDQLRHDVAACAARLARARSTAAAAAAHRERLEMLAESLPSADSIAGAARELEAAERHLSAGRARFETDRRRAEERRAAANRLSAAVAHEAATDGLPVRAGELDDVITVLADLRERLLEYAHHLRDLGRDSERRDRLRDDESARRAEAADTAAEARLRRNEHDTAAHELAALRAALGVTVEAVVAQHGRVEERLRALDQTLLPSAEEVRREADSRRATTAALLTAARRTEAERAAGVGAHADALGTAVSLPGVVLAATGGDSEQLSVEPSASPLALAAAIAASVDGDDEVSDGTVLSRYDRLSEALAGGYDTAIDERAGVKVVHVADDTGRQPLAVVAARLADEAEAAQHRLAAREREVLERFLLRELADEVRSKLLDATDLVVGTNRMLAAIRTSHGKGALLEWKLRDDHAAAALADAAVPLLHDALRDETSDAQLRDALLALIDTERAADPSASYEQHLRVALDYRSWYRFTVRVTDAAKPGSSRTLSSRLGLSQGEQRVLSYLALFAAAAAHFDAIARDTATAPRLLLLDDAFAKVDEPTHGRLLGHLVELGLDFVLTSERMWGCFPSVPGLEIYEAVRDPADPGVALVHFRWDGRQRHLVGV